MISVDDIDAFIFDFDGVLTNNHVYIDQSGGEWVKCSRSDGLAFDVLRKLKKPTYILSTEKNKVVLARAKKLKIPVIQGVENKANELLILAKRNNFNFERMLYVGNDLNDYRAMKLCGYTICPGDSHEKIKEIATVILKSDGGDGVAREILEYVLKLDFIKILFNQ